MRRMEITKQSCKAPILRELPSRLLGQTAALVGRIAGEALAQTQAHRHHFAVLATLEAFGPASQAELCRRTDLDRSDMNAALNVLEDRGEIQRRTDPADRRQNIVKLTRRGKERFTELRIRIEEGQNRALASLSAAERATLILLLQRLHDDLAAEPQTDPT